MPDDKGKGQTNYKAARANCDCCVAKVFVPAKTCKTWYYKQILQLYSHVIHLYYNLYGFWSVRHVGPLYKHGLSDVTVWISNPSHCSTFDVITHDCSYFNFALNILLLKLRHGSALTPDCFTSLWFLIYALKWTKEISDKRSNRKVLGSPQSHVTNCLNHLLTVDLQMIIVVLPPLLSSLTIQRAQHAQLCYIERPTSTVTLLLCYICYFHI